MEKLKQTKKITKTTLKSFIKRNQGKLFYKVQSDFDGMQDCVDVVKMDWLPVTEVNLNVVGGDIVSGEYKGVWLTHGRNWFELYEDDKYIGIRVYNSCGSSIVAIKK